MEDIKLPEIFNDEDIENNKIRPVCNVCRINNDIQDVTELYEEYLEEKAKMYLCSLCINFHQNPFKPSRELRDFATGMRWLDARISDHIRLHLRYLKIKEGFQTHSKD